MEQKSGAKGGRYGKQEEGRGVTEREGEEGGTAREEERFEITVFINLHRVSGQVSAAFL